MKFNNKEHIPLEKIRLSFEDGKSDLLNSSTFTCYCKGINKLEAENIPEIIIDTFEKYDMMVYHTGINGYSYYNDKPILYDKIYLNRELEIGIIFLSYTEDETKNEIPVCFYKFA